MVYGLVLTSNRRMLDLCANLGFTIETLPGEESRAHIHLK